ncbi:diphthamide biosynthesis enzyme Dph2, partial [Candidatus Micrarchaeota archaeon]|nr:diphthamide biosynthesis enzyme Dph2 [Candidatus Micrarchaeota archaeon]MBU1930392.1 diphthamide biosynthesis enzyme Dph2 [Candidatus Micrarchaeota archaeon]
MLDVNLEPVFKAIQKQKPKLVLLQFPEGLKTRLKQITEKLEETTNVTIVSLIEPCFGACMLAETKAQLLGADLLVHFGHSRFYPEKIPTIFVPLEYKISETQLQKTIETIAQELSQKKLNRIGLVTTIQYLNALLPIQKRLEKKGFSVLIGMGQNVLAGQVLGCNFSSALFIIEKVDTIVYVGDGTFHPIGIGLALKKPVFSISPMESEWTEMGNEKESFLKKRLAIIGSLHEARSFGILVSTQTGQLHLSQALEAKKEI